jgi:alpha-galactosidase
MRRSSGSRRGVKAGWRATTLPCLALSFWVVALGPDPAASQDSGTTFLLAGHEVRVAGDLGPFEMQVDVRREEAGLEIARLRLTAPESSPPPAFALQWSLPSHDVSGQWTTGSHLNKALVADWAMSRVSSMLARNAPVMTLFGSDDGNRLTFAASDALNTVNLMAGIHEEDATVRARMEFFSQPHRAVRQLELEVRFDTRPVPFHEALSGVSRWWAGQAQHTPSPVPEAARLPMYSTWYSYHQEVSVPELLREVELARPLGYEAIIVDDGWQTLDNRRGYAFTGDWRPERIPEMRDFVDHVHQRGMKVLLWYAMSLVGERSEVFQRFQGRFLRYWDGQGAYVLDPRYPEVREHIIDTYRQAMRRWGVDGFKLDFLGFFVATDSTVLTAEDGRDYASVNEATDRLMTDVMLELRRERPDVMIEFRQPYVGPLMRKYGNMFRAGDAPNSAVENRVRTVDLRLLSGKTAVHSDMFMWHAEEPLETAALQFLNILFSVPQLSVRLELIPEDHRDMVAFWTSYWRRNRSVLLDGDFSARSPMANYSQVEAWSSERRIVAVYSDPLVRVGESGPIESLDVVNATAAEHVVLDVDRPLGAWRFRILDPRGREIGTGRVVLDVGLHGFDVPRAGLLLLEPVRD